MRDEISKLMIENSIGDHHQLFIRSPSKKGVKIISVDDGTEIDETEDIHSKPIS